MEYRAIRLQGGMEVRGESTRKDRLGIALIQTNTLLRDGLGIEEITVTTRGQTVRAQRIK